MEANSGTDFRQGGCGGLPGVVFKLKDWGKLGMERLRGTAL